MDPACLVQAKATKLKQETPESAFKGKALYYRLTCIPNKAIAITKLPF